MLNSKLKEIAKTFGKLPTYTDLGCYPIFYVNNHSVVLCADCANQHADYDETIVDCDVNYEDTAMYCDHCSKQIESAYADDEVGYFSEK